MSVQSDSLVKRALWPALLLAVFAYVVADFIQHPFLGVPSDAAVTPEAHLTLWMAQTEAGQEAAATVQETAGSLLLYGRPATVGVLQGGSSQAVITFLAHRRSPDDLLAVSSETVADLAQERSSALVGEEPLRAALAQRLLAHAVPVGLLSRDPLAIAVPPNSTIHSAAELLEDLHNSPQGQVFALADDNWAADNLASLVQDAGVEGVVPYRVFPSVEEASLALSAGSANVLLASRGTILPELRAHTLRELKWPATAGQAPSSWIELLAAPGTSPSQVAALRRQLQALTANAVWRGVLRNGGQDRADSLSGPRLRLFLPEQITRVTGLQQVALRTERH